MQPVYITDPAWWTTFQHLVAPLPDEWLPGLLLRCDVVNSWESGTTFFDLLRPIRPRPYKLWTHTPDLTVLSSFDLSPLAQLLALPMDTLLATTYEVELARIFDLPYGLSVHLAPSFTFHLCPECIKLDRRLKRVLLLPQILCCSEHEVILVKKCQCGMPLRLFSARSLPFTCHACGLDWAELPRVPADQEYVLKVKKHLLHYKFFFSKGTRTQLEKALLLINEKLMKLYGNEYIPANRRFLVGPPDLGEISLGALVSTLVSFDLLPQDIQEYAGALQSGTLKWRRFYFSSVMKIFAASLHMEDPETSS